LAGLEQLLASAPAQLRTFVVSRRDPKLGLHRLRLAGALTEIRAADLEFSAEEASELMAAAGVPAGDPARPGSRSGADDGQAQVPCRLSLTHIER
jgi:ATP/maltotriose-dependent transcriptional regulator MalT